VSSKGDGKKQRRKGLLTPMQSKFVECFKGNATEAARQAGFEHPNSAAGKLLKDPDIRAALEVKQQILREEEAKAEGKEAGKRQGIERGEIIDLLAGIARTGENEGARVRALMGLAELKHMRISRLADVSREYDNRTEEELEFFALNGYWPEEQQSVDAGKPGPSGLAGRSKKTRKPDPER
jgi:flagellar biosynthesis/type III secretory pathway protein FliH